MKIFRILLIEPERTTRTCLTTALQRATPLGVHCRIEITHSMHQAFHLLRGFDAEHIPDLIVSYHSLDSPLETAFDVCCYNDLLHGIEYAVAVLNLNIPVIITQQSYPPTQKDEPSDRIHPVRCELVAQEYRTHVQRKFPPTASLLKLPSPSL